MEIKMIDALVNTQYNTILVVNALSGALPILLREKYPHASIICAEVTSDFIPYLNNLGFETIYWNDINDMKFDLIIGNPPYKELADNGRQTNKSIWKDFIVKSTTLLNKNGIMMFVTPTGWCSPSDNGKLIENIFSRLNLIYADISDSVKDHFNGIGSTFGYTITVNEPYANKTVIKTNDGVHVVDLKKTKLITKVGMSIITKLTTSLHPQCRFKLAGKEYQYSGTGYHTDEKPADAIYKNIHHVNSGKDYLPGTTIPVRWSVDKSSVSDCRKVVIPYNGPVNVIVDSGEYGVGWCQTLLLGDDDLIDAAEHVFGGKLFKFFANQRSTQYNETKNLNQFPMLDLTHRWTDEEIYEHFNLTEEEIELVKSY